ncbi:hypothetical protein [Aeribacillus composti]|nr:hypothetical protein [Aeribacillus composti]
MYSGPNADEIITDAIKNGNYFELLKEQQTTVLKVYSTTAYDIKIVDNYWYNENGELIKQTILINNKEKVIFDKFKEAESMLLELERDLVVAS